MTLQSEDMGKLVAGRSVVRSLNRVKDYREVGDLLTVEAAQTDVGMNVVWYRANNGNVAYGPASLFSYVGERTPDGWIEGEWADNPVGDMEVLARSKVAPSVRGQKLNAKSVVWPRVGAFRPAHREAQPETDGGGERIELTNASEVWDLIDPKANDPIIAVLRRAGTPDAVLVEAAYAVIADRKKRALPTPEGQTEVQYEVWQDDMMVATADSLSDAQHYAVIYGQDGPVQTFTATTVRVPTDLAALASKGV